MATRPGLCPIAQETASAAPTLCTEYGPDGWMDGWMELFLAFPGIAAHSLTKAGMTQFQSLTPSVRRLESVRLSRTQGIDDLSHITSAPARRSCNSISPPGYLCP